MERLEKALRKALNAPDGTPLPAPVRIPEQLSTAEEGKAAVTRTPTSGTTDPPGLWQSLREIRPSLRALSRGLVVTGAEEPDARHFELLGAKLLHQVRSQGWQRIGIAAPRPGCGATTVALNLAFGLAQQAELRLLLIEADAYRPSMGAAVGLAPGAGLAEVVAGRAEPAQALLRLRSNLAALLASRVRSEPGELLGDPATLDAIERIEALLDPSVTLIDLPPILDGSGAESFWEGLDGVLLVISAGSTTLPEIEACQRALRAGANLLGVVVNRCRSPDRTEGPGLAPRRRGRWAAR